MEEIDVHLCGGQGLLHLNFEIGLLLNLQFTKTVSPMDASTSQCWDEGNQLGLHTWILEGSTLGPHACVDKHFINICQAQPSFTHQTVYEKLC